MNIYTYDAKTLEYKQTLVAEADPEETKLQGKFVPLVPAYATLTAPPEFAQNQIPVFENGDWVIKTDYRKNYKLVDDNFMVSDIKEIGEPKSGYIVDLETSKEIQANSDRFKILDDTVIKKTDTEYASEQAQKEAERINKLTMTALDFIGVLQSFGLTLEQINAYLETNLEVKMQLTYCQNVYCGVAKSLMPIMFEDITITADMVEIAFRVKNGEEIEEDNGEASGETSSNPPIEEE